MILVRMVCYFVVLLLSSYSFLRYYHLFRRNRIPNIFYFVLHAVLLMNGFVVSRKVTWISYEWLRNILQGIAAIYMSVLLYTPVFCFLRGIVRAIGKRKEKQGRIYKFFNHPAKTIYIILLLTAGIGGWSIVNMRTIRETSYSISVEKKAEQKELSVIYLSDAHIGSGMTRTGLDRFVDRVNAAKPDLIVLGGDIFDSNTSDDLKNYASEQFRKLKAKQGIYFVEGNHEIRLKEDVSSYFTKAGITVLKDQIAFLPNGIQVVGLRDGADKKKIAVEQLMKSIDKKKPVLVLSHRPEELEKLSQLGADAVFCGHTHGGQYPLGFLAVLAVNDMNYGIKKYGTMSAVTSSGAGGFGIPSKLTVPSEYLNVKITFSE